MEKSQRLKAPSTVPIRGMSVFEPLVIQKRVETFKTNRTASFRSNLMNREPHDEYGTKQTR